MSGTETFSLSFRYGEALFMNSKLIGGVTEFLNTERELNEVGTQKHTGAPAGIVPVHFQLNGAEGNLFHPHRNRKSEYQPLCPLMPIIYLSW